jgi:membrane-bound metal-dependent hydrolase YbcI (DUF457 family)
MPAFKTHISFGAVSGAIIGWILLGYNLTFEKGLFLPVLFALLLGSILPDLDSDEGKPFKITLESFSVLCVIMYYLSWLNSPDEGYLNLGIGVVGTYVIAKYLVGNAIRKITHHRGMFHSIPALLIAMLVAIILLSYFQLNDTQIITLAGALGVGFLSHLVLDQIANYTGKRNLFWGHHHSHPRALKFFSFLAI